MKTKIKITLFEKLNEYQFMILKDRIKKVLQKKGYSNYKFNKKDNPVPSLDYNKFLTYKDMKFLLELGKAYLDYHYNKKEESKYFKIFAKLQNGVQTDKEQPKKLIKLANHMLDFKNQPNDFLPAIIKPYKGRLLVEWENGHQAVLTKKDIIIKG